MRKKVHFVLMAVLTALLASLPAHAQEGEGFDSFPLYAPLVNLQPPALLVQGAITIDAEPLADVVVELQPCTADPIQVAQEYTAATDFYGSYLFVLPELDISAAVSYTLRYDASAQPLVQASTISATFASFQSHCFMIEQGLGNVAALDMPTINIAAPVFINSQDVAPQPMPVTFVWGGRDQHAPRETYQWQADVQFDCDDCAPVYIESNPINVHDASYMPSLTWTCIYRHREGSGDVRSIDYWMEVVNDLGVGISAVNHTPISTTVHECPAP